MKIRPRIGLGTFALVLGANYTLGTAITSLSQTFPFTTIPPGLTFGVSRWSIYILLTVICISRLATQRSRESHLTNLSKWFTLSNILNISWIVLTYTQYYLASVFVIIALGVCLHQIMRSIVVKHRHFRFPTLLKAGFGLYLGRITLAASAIGIGQAVSIRIPGIFESGVWSIVSLISGLVACRLVVRSTSPWVVLTPIWWLAMIGWKVFEMGDATLGFLARWAAIILLIPAYQAYRNPYCITT